MSPSPRSRHFYSKKIKINFIRIKNITDKAWFEIGRVQLFLVAAGLAYTTILSVIPLLAVSLAIFEAFGGLEKVFNLLRPFVLSNLAEGVGDQVIVMLETFIQNTHTKTVGITGLVALLFTSITMLSSIESAINTLWSVQIKRTWLRRITSYGFLITLGPVALAIALGIESSHGLPIRHLLPSGVGFFLITAGIFSWTYQSVPDTHVIPKYSVISGIAAASGLTFARFVYSAYTSKFVSYGKIYGSLSAIPILLLWIYIAWLIILGGAALTAGLQKTHQSSKRAAFETS